MVLDDSIRHFLDFVAAIVVVLGAYWAWGQTKAGKADSITQAYERMSHRVDDQDERLAAMECALAEKDRRINEQEKRIATLESEVSDLKIAKATMLVTINRMRGFIKKLLALIERHGVAMPPDMAVEAQEYRE